MSRPHIYTLSPSYERWQSLNKLRQWQAKSLIAQLHCSSRRMLPFCRSMLGLIVASLGSFFCVSASPSASTIAHSLHITHFNPTFLQPRSSCMHAPQVQMYRP